MSDSDCTNCANWTCPYKQEDHFNCYVNKAIEVKRDLSPDQVALLRNVVDRFSGEAPDFLDDEYRALVLAAKDLLELRKADVSGGGPR